MTVNVTTLFHKNKAGDVWVLAFTLDPNTHTVDRSDEATLAQFTPQVNIDSFLKHIGAREVRDFDNFIRWCDDAGV